MVWRIKMRWLNHNSKVTLLQVSAVCALVVLVFALFALTYLKGALNACSLSGVFDAELGGTPQEGLLEWPRAWRDLSPRERAWFGPNDTLASGAWAAAATGSGGLAPTSSPSSTPSLSFSFEAGADGDDHLGTVNGSFSYRADDETGASLLFGGNASSSTCGGRWPDAPCCAAWGRSAAGAGGAAFDEGALPTSRELCACWGGTWEPVIAQSFDNAAVAMLTLFEMMTTEGWVDVMFAAAAAVGPDAQPRGGGEQRVGTALWSVFFVVFLLVGSFLMMSLFIGVVLDNFEAKRRDDSVEKSLPVAGGAMLTDAQKAWVWQQQVGRAALFSPRLPAQWWTAWLQCAAGEQSNCATSLSSSPSASSPRTPTPRGRRPRRASARPRGGSCASPRSRRS